MSRLDIRWPDEAAERVRAAQGRLERAGAALRARSLPNRIGAVARVLEDWTRPDSPWRRELIESFSATSPFSRGTVAEGLESALRAWDPARFVAMAERELASVLPGAEGGAPSRALAPFAWTAVLAGGTIPMPTLLTSLLPLVLGSPVLLRETSKDPVTGRLLARSLAARDTDLARAFEPIELPTEDGEALAGLLSAPCVVATGGDDTMRAIAARLRADQRFVAYGHRVSIAVVGPDTAGALEPIAAGLALDVARWDQTGCLSPIVALLVGLGPETQRDLAAAIARALDALSTSMPRGELPIATRALHASERAEARMRAASGRAQLFETRDALVVLEEDATARPAPLHRFLRLLPVASIGALAPALEALGAPLSNVALAGFGSDAKGELAATLAHHGASRVTRPGRLQTPPVDWPRDGWPLFVPLARFVSPAD
ncbi:MAG: acyl-CoA reductase [Myxococcota bacterium]